MQKGRHIAAPLVSFLGSNSLRVRSHYPTVQVLVEFTVCVVLLL